MSGRVCRHVHTIMSLRVCVCVRVCVYLYVNICLCYRSHLSLYFSVYLVLIKPSPGPPGLHLQVRSLVLRDQQVKFTGL